MATDTVDLAETVLRTQARLISDDFLRFAVALREAEPALDWTYFLKKPWKWAKPYAVWVEVGRPTEDADPADVAGWRRFLQALDGEEGE